MASPQSRLRQRRRVLLWSVPVLVLLLAMAVVAVNVVLAGRAAVNAFNTHDIDALRTAVERLRGFALIDSATTAFANGDLLVLEGRLTDAEAEFAKALDSTAADESCPVRVNLELVRESLADLAVYAGRIEEAGRLYRGAAEVITGAPAGCFADNTDPNEERRAIRADAESRLDRKLENLKRPPPPKPTRVPVVTPEPPPPPDTPAEEHPVPPSVQALPGENLPVPPPPGSGPEGESGGSGAAPDGQPGGSGDQPGEEGERSGGQGEQPGGEGEQPGGPGPDGQPGAQQPAPDGQPGDRASGEQQSGEQPAADPQQQGDPGGQPVVDPSGPQPQILEPVGADGLPIAEADVASPRPELGAGGKEPIDRLQKLLEDANSFGGQAE